MPHTCNRACLLACLPLLIGVAVTTSAAPVVQPDLPGLVSHNDVVYLFPAREGWEGLPLGNGTLGAQVWQPDGLAFQLNTPWSGAYAGAICRVRVRPEVSMLSGLKSYRQKLSLYDANLSTEAITDTGTVSANCFVPADTDGLVLTYSDARRAAQDTFVDLETWRPGAAHTAADGVLLMTDTLSGASLAQRGLALAGTPDYRFAVAVAAEGGAAVAEAGGAGVPHLRLTGGKFTLWVAFAGSRDPRGGRRRASPRAPRRAPHPGPRRGA